MSGVSTFLIVIFLLSPVIPAFSNFVHPVSFFGTANQPFQVWLGSPLIIRSEPCGVASVTLPDPTRGSCNLRQQSDLNPTCEAVVNPASTSSYNLPLENGATAQPNLWGLNSATGRVEQCYGTNGLQTSIQLSAINSKFPEALGYTEVVYGNNLNDQAVPSGSINQLGFPSLLRTFDALDLWATATYGISTPTPTGMPYRLFYDLWLEQNPSPGNSPSSADFEVGITFAYTPLNPIEYPIPIWTLSNEPIIINGHSETSRWNLYKALLPGSSAANYDFFLASPSQPPSNTISIRLQDFIDGFGKYLSSPESYLFNPLGPHNLSGYRLMGVELGTEFAGGVWELTEPSNIQLKWDWRLSAYLLSTASSTINLITSQTQSMQTSASVSCSPSSVVVSNSIQLPTGCLTSACSFTIYAADNPVKTVSAPTEGSFDYIQS